MSGPRDPWEPVDPFPGLPPPAEARVRRWAVVLEARGIECRIREAAAGSVLLVPARLRGRAERELRLYEVENRGWPAPAPDPPPVVRNERRTFAVLVALGLFHDLTFQAPGRVLGIAVEWHRLGAMDSARVLAGEWWRVVTALTLHADGLHLAGNFILGGILLVQLNRQLGVGPGMALVLAAGALGNLTNALVRPPVHRSIGSSTAVFAALGALVARAAWRGSGRDWKRWVVPLGAGAGLIAMTGVGGARTDYLAHLFGFFWGLVAGTLTEWPRPVRRPPTRRLSWTLGLAAVAVVAASWAAALLWG